jgi:CubicO group peptidase (beta-lactamase class C family)
VSTFFPEYGDLFTGAGADARRGQIRLKDMLTMTAGMSWDESSFGYGDPRNTSLQAMLSPDPMRYILARPMVAAPGAAFAYNTGSSVALGQVIHKASGLAADKFAERHLFAPLGITDYYWAKVSGNVDDIVETSGGLFLRPRDMAKLGQLFLDGGRWRGKQIISRAWIDESTKNYMPAGTNLPAWVQADGYGYQWWLGTFRSAGAVGGDDRAVRSYSARGRGGQFIFVFPDEQLVAVFTGLNDNILMNQPLDMLQRYILPAAGALPELGAATRPSTSTAPSH